MGLRSQIRNWLLSRGRKVPGFLVREHDRLFHRTVNNTRPGMTVLDIGANRGEISRAFAARGATVHAFEPNPDILSELQELAAQDPRIKVENCGILDKNTEMKLYLHSDYAGDPQGHSESSSFLRDKPNVSSDSYLNVPVRDIAEVIAGIGSFIDIVKIDVEGAEYRILTRMIESGCIKNVGSVFVETHHDRIPSLQPEYDRLKELIAARGLNDRICFDWV